MDNPFEKRATEYIADAPAFLPLVSPEPIDAFMYPERGALFDKLTMWVGTPGAGKTTLARVMEFETLFTLSRHEWSKNKELAALLSSFGVYKDGVAALLCFRLPMTTNFRSIWELPYDVKVKESLLKAFVQSKAVLGWLRQLERVGVNLDDVKVELRDDGESTSNAMKTESIYDFRDHARNVEFSVFQTITALMPPSENEFRATLANYRYDIFEEIRGFRVEKWPEGFWPACTLRPMIIVDDAHELHSAQFTALGDWLKSRVIRIARWVMCRLDGIPPAEYRAALKEGVKSETTPAPGSTIGRDYYIKVMQMRGQSNRRFRKAATDIAGRYFTHLPAFARNSVSALESVLDIRPPTFAPSSLRQLQDEVEQYISANISPRVRESLEARIRKDVSPEERYAALNILVHREVRNAPQVNLFRDDEVSEDEQLKINERQANEIGEKHDVNASLIDGGRIQLMHRFKRPYYFGMDKLTDASNMNIEQFLSLSEPLVGNLLAKIIRGRPLQISAADQHRVIQERACQLMERWDFPYCDSVRKLVDWIGERCKERTLLDYAPLDDGANAVGVLQSEMDQILNKSERLARVLHFAFAYRAIEMVPEYGCKGKIWCLLELGGIPILAKGLTLKHGGFIESRLTHLQDQLPA